MAIPPRRTRIRPYIRYERRARTRGDTGPEDKAHGDPDYRNPGREDPVRGRKPLGHRLLGQMVGGQTVCADRPAARRGWSDRAGAEEKGATSSMDEIKMVGDLLSPERPANVQVTADARGRLLDEIGAKGRRRPRLRSGPGWLMIGVVSAATAALVITPTVLLSNRSADTRVGDAQQKQDGRVLNVLLVGSDGRLGAAGARADTIVLMHLPADRKKITAVSLPRDSRVRIPACKSSAGATTPARVGRLSSAMTAGGAPCVRRTVEAATGVHVDHAVEVDYTGVKRMVDALGGVEVTLPKAVDDRWSGLRLPAGRHRLNGTQAVAYVRTRHGLGEGSDLDRMKRQQRFMVSLFTRASERLAQPAQLYAFLRAADRSIATDPTLSAKGMYSIATSLRNTGPRDVRFTIVPSAASPAGIGMVEWRRPEADRLFAPFRSGD
jgi:LCP family protein required for cell wall assembly